MVTKIENLLTTNKLLQTIVILLGIVFSVGGASYALSEKIGNLNTSILLNESSIKENKLDVTDLKNFKEKGDRFTLKVEEVFDKRMTNLESVFTDFRMDIKNQLSLIQKEVTAINLKLTRLEATRGISNY